ncbi:MAG: hypothetical protein WC635_01015 [Bacteriovorax sp.]|jgi:hypothetical protein
MKYILGLVLTVLSFQSFAYEVTRQAGNSFPRCIASYNNSEHGTNLFFRWKDQVIDRKVEVSFSQESCQKFKNVLFDQELVWENLDRYKTIIPEKIFSELKQIEQKTNELREDLDADNFLKKHPLSEYTISINRDLSKRYGQLFSAQVFKAFIENKKINSDLKADILNDLRSLKQPLHKPFADLSGNVKLVVSFGLGWEEKYNRTTPVYITNFLNDIKSLGLPVLFLKNNPFGKVSDNIQKIIPDLSQELESGKDLILISLCKGTPELLAAEAELANRNIRGRILGHVNLSGMLGGAIFSDYAKEIILPKVVAPLLKLIPNDEIRDSARMVDALEYMKSSVIAPTLLRASPLLDKDIFYVNITGSPMTNAVFKGKSPMKPILNYNAKNAFVAGANDGFLELPNTLIPESISTNQASIILDSSHLLSDGSLEEFNIGVESSRRILYYSVVKNILQKSR